MQQPLSSSRSSAAVEEDATIPPPTAAIPALRFGLSESRPPASASSAPAGRGTTSTLEHPSGSLAEEDVRWERREGCGARGHSSSDEDGADGVERTSSPPALRRPSALFDTALATEALFERFQQRLQTQGERIPPPPTSLSSRFADGEPPARRPSVPISSVLGRPPTAPTGAPGVATSSAAEAYPFATSQREPSSSSFRGHQRSASPTSTADYVEIEHKQNELRYAVEHHIQSLERSLALRDEEVATLSSRLQKLEEDYQFNYNLIAERDAALEEASAQLQRLYRELKRLTEEAAQTGKKVDVAEAELKAARQRVREVEEERDGAVRQVQRDYAIKERHLFDGIRAKETALEQEQKEQHQWYKEQARLLEEERTALADRNVSVSMEADERCKQQVGRLQSELTGMHRELKATRQAKADDERRIAVLGEEKAALLHEATIAQERHDAAIQEVTLAKREVEDRLVRATAEAEKRAAAAEAATREESTRASRLELERTRLQAMLSEAQERIQHLTTQFDDDIARYTKERQTLLKRNDVAVAATAAVEQSLQDAQRELEKERRVAAEEMERMSRDLERARSACEEAQKAQVVAEEKGAKWEAAAERLEAEVRRWKSEEDRTATSGRQERSAWEERCRQAERQVQLLQEEAQQSTRLHQGALEKAQCEAMRLTRELHASEAARRTLEDQFHLLEDYKEERGALQTLRMEKEQLQKRVGELEHTNEEVRQQVAAFTTELQNDPIIKAAKESQQRMVELQQELTAAKSEIQLMRDTITEKEDELVRYQTEMLRVQVLMGSDNDAPATIDTVSNNQPLRFNTPALGLSDQVSRALQRQQQQMRSEYSKMRESYEEMVRELDRQRRHRRHKTATPVSRAASASSSAPSNHSSTGQKSSSSDTSRNGNRVERRRRRRHHQSGIAVNAERSSVPLPPVLPDSKAAHLVQETEVWRQRCVQLEQQLHTILRERDRLKKELQLAKQDVVALGTEKQSLVDLNSLLKAQLREAYRMRGGDTAARIGSIGSTSSAATLPPFKDVRVSPGVLAAALKMLEEGGYDGTATAAQSTPPSFAATHSVNAGEAAMRTSPANVAREAPPMVHSTRGFGATGGLQAPSAATAPGRASAQAAQERLATLQREIDNVRGQLSGSNTALPQSRQPVVRRGTTSVRHYGYGG